MTYQTFFRTKNIINLQYLSSVKVELNNNLDIALVKNNALVGAKVAVALGEKRKNCER